MDSKKRVEIYEEGKLKEIQEIEVEAPSNQDLIAELEAELWPKLEELRNLKSQ